MTDKAIFLQVARRLGERFPQARVLAYGSRARGDAKPDSDLDICVILDAASPDAEMQIREVTWEIGFEHDVLISTVILFRNEIEGGPLQASPFVINVLREGITA